MSPPEPAAPPPPAVIVSCEHAGNRVPSPFAVAFAGRRRLLASHRGWDPGALVLARRLAAVLDCPLHFSTVSRLVADPNRSVSNPAAISPMMRSLGGDAVRSAIERHHAPYRALVEREAALIVASGRPVLHLSVHSFTPVLNGRPRRADIGLLYDPRSTPERDLCARWKSRLAAAAPGLRVLRNSPYRGTSDGLTTHLRRRLGPDLYAGIELEVNQKFPLGPPGEWRRIRRILADTLRQAIGAGAA